MPRPILFMLPLLLLTATSLRADSTTQPTPTRTKAQVDKLIEDAGKTPPDWWDTTPLNLPPSLDLSWNQPKGKWDSQRILPQYLWDIIYPNPAKWREGVKLIQHSIAVNKGNAFVMAQASERLANIYTEMLQDYARGAYWAKINGQQPFTLVECYIKLGCKPAAVELLNKIGRDDTFNAVSIKLWAELGDMKSALAWADDIAAEAEESGEKYRQSAALLSAADACRNYGDIKTAVAYYNKVVALWNPTARDRKRAESTLALIKFFDNLDLSKIPDGSFKDSSQGYVGPVTVEVTVKSHKITDVKVTDHHEKQFYSSLTEVPPQIVAKQSVKNIDTTTGATITSEAIINASAKALAKPAASPQ